MITEKEAILLLKKHIPDKEIQNNVIKHSKKVQKTALKLSKGIKNIDLKFIKIASLLHDIGRMDCPPKTKKAILHGIKGAAILRKEAKNYNTKEFEAYAKVAERHLGAGIRKKDIKKQKLQIPEKDYIPKTKEEKIITTADNLTEKVKGKYTEAPIEKIVERFNKEIGKETGKRIKSLYEEVMNMKK